MESRGSRIRRVRQHYNHTQEEFAARLAQEFDGHSITRGAVGNWERDKGIKFSNLDLISRVFNVPLNWLGGDSSAGPVWYEAEQGTDEDLSYHPLYEDVYTTADHEEGQAFIGRVDGVMEFHGKIPGSTPEVAYTPGAGLGQDPDQRAIQIGSRGIATGHEVVAEWVIPPEYVRSVLSAKPGNVVFLPVLGDSMEPTLRSGDRIMVDTSQNHWIGDAIYVIRDYDGIPRVKRLQKVTGSRPPVYHVISDNPAHERETLGADRFDIVGRVVGRFTKV